VVRLYNTNGVSVCEPLGADGTIPFNFTQWAWNNGIVIPEGRYYATVYDTGSPSVVYYQSNTVTYSGGGVSLTLSPDGKAVATCVNYDEYVYDATWVLKAYDGQEVWSTVGGSTVDFSH
jgi:hypothetical protein